MQGLEVPVSIGLGREAGEAIPHGGDLGEARRLFPDAPEPWLDLSTGMNPVPYPCPPLDASVWQRLPSAQSLCELKAIAAVSYAVPGSDHVAAGPGTQILIETLPRLLAPTRVAVIGPTYAEHAAAWARAGHAVATVHATAEIGDAQVVVVVTPNNPDGRVLQAGERRALEARLSGRGGLLVLDEAFADLEPDWEPSGTAPGRVVLRSFGKSYGLAGLRLGFALAEPRLVQRIEAALGPWAVSGPAIEIGRVALADTVWREDATRRCARDAARLDRMIRRAGGRLAGGTVLFRTADFDEGAQLFRRLGEAGIFVRRYPELPSRLRFGLPASKADWCRLSRVLKA